MAHSVRAMAQYDRYHLYALSKALQFAGTTGRTGTMEDLVDARLGTSRDSTAWRCNFVTDSTEYRGRSRAGHHLIVVAHGKGPLSATHAEQSTHEGMREIGENGRYEIPRKLFLKLLSGLYGEVSAVDTKVYARERSKNGGNGQELTLQQSLEDTLLIARLGKNAQPFLRKHAELTREWLAANKDSGLADVAIMRNFSSSVGASQYLARHLHMDGTYFFTERDSPTHILGHSEIGEGNSEFMSAYCVFGVRGDGPIRSITPPLETLYENIILPNWRAFLQPANSDPPSQVLMHRDGRWFTQHMTPDGLATNQAAFPVRILERLNDLHLTTQKRVDGVLRATDISARAVECMPSAANAAWVTPKVAFNMQTETQENVIRYYRALATHSHRLPMIDELRRDIDATLERCEATGASLL